MQKSINLFLDVDNVPYTIKATPCIYNEDLQYKVSVNGDEEVLFIFDSEIGRYAAEGDDGATIPDNVENEIGNELNSYSLKDQK